MARFFKKKTTPPPLEQKHLPWRNIAYNQSTLYLNPTYPNHALKYPTSRMVTFAFMCMFIDYIPYQYKIIHHAFQK